MEDESTSLEGKGLLNMRVVDLKQELEKRGLSKSGSKKDLVKRLKQQLEFEKLSEERKSGDFPLNLELDAEIQQNEFVQQYLAQQQKRYAERQAEKRLEFEAMQKCQEDSTVTAEYQSDDDENESSDTDKKGKEENIISESTEKVIEIENIDVLSKKFVESEKNLPISQCESKTEILEENADFPKPPVSICNIDAKNPQTIVQDIVPEIKNTKLISKCLLETDSEKLIVSEHKQETYNDACMTDNIDDSEKQKQFEKTTFNQSFKEANPNVAVKFDSELTEHSKCQSDQSDFSFASNEVENIASSNKDSRQSPQRQTSSEIMEVSDCSSVPYSLSDIQLPESPGRHVELKDTKCSEKNQIDHVSDEVTDESTHSKNKSKSNGDSTHKLNSSQEEMSESETKDSSYSSDSPEKMKRVKNKKHSDESSDSESYTNKISYKKKSIKYEDNSSNLAVDSDDDNPKETSRKERYSSDSPEKNNVKNKRNSDDSSDAESNTNKIPYKKKSAKYEDSSSKLDTDSEDDHLKETVRKEQKYAKSQSSDDSSSEKSSDSEKYSRHAESKHKSRGKHRKRDKRSSSYSSSRSSDSSPEKRNSNKPADTKSKGFVEDECHKKSFKDSDKKSIKYKKNDTGEESSEDNVSNKKRLKLKRDNVPVEIPSPTKESVETNTTNKSIEKDSNSYSTSDKPSKKESHEEKEEKPDINFKARKVMLPSLKLNRNTCEANIEPKSKLDEWISTQYFSTSFQKHNKLAISADSLKNWFPHFKLTSEASVEVEQDEHSFSATDEKFSDVTQGDTLNENESSMKQEYTSEMDVEDSISQEPDFDEAVELGNVSKIIFIQNLVRPFTLNQLKDLLRQSGKIIEEYFWIDKIKSKCFVMYETEKEAIKARNALNNTRWPTSNPKILSVEFSNIEELENHQKGNEPQTLKPPEPSAIESSDILEPRVSHPVEEHKRKDKERRKEKDRTKIQAPVREWDKDKIVQDSPEREHPPKEEKSRSTEKKEKKESKKRAAEDTPAKLLDDLFQKTKSVPCIYWLPLTEEQAKAKEEQKKARRLEREKRNQEEAERRNRRARSSSRRREKENRKSSTRSRSPVPRRR